MKIAPIPGIWWAASVLTGQRSFPTYEQKPKKGEGFKEVFDKAMEEKPWEKEIAKNALTMS